MEVVMVVLDVVRLSLTKLPDPQLTLGWPQSGLRAGLVVVRMTPVSGT
jgi:hypothetical protein